MILILQLLVFSLLRILELIYREAMKTKIEK